MFVGMCLVSRGYRKQFVCRYDKEVGVPFYSHEDFKGLYQEAYTFTNSLKAEIHYFFYYYDNYKEDKIILFCHGLGPGHTAYLKEIETLAKYGYKVLTLDYMGCGESKGKLLRSLNEPTRDANELLDFLKLDLPIVVVGHSLGGYTALNLMNLRKNLQKAVILSGFITIPSLVEEIIKSKFVSSRILKYEQKMEPELSKLDNIEYLKNTTEDLFFIQSDDDMVVPYSLGLEIVEKIDNPHIKTLKVTGKKHNPNYSYSALEYMNEVFGKYASLLNEKKIKTDEDKINYFKDVSLPKLVEQDEEIFKLIFDFID